jgi:FAD/FMN-containing dehydrogenase
MLERVNDLHSALNETPMQVERPTHIEEIRRLVTDVAASGRHLTVCGGRHAMGGQQFAVQQTLLDLRGMNQVIDLDLARGLARAQAGVQWPVLIQAILDLQQKQIPSEPPKWGIAQKQTGADNLTLGGSLSANAHGRGLRSEPREMRRLPAIADV